MCVYNYICIYICIYIYIYTQYQVGLVVIALFLAFFHVLSRFLSCYSKARKRARFLSRLCSLYFLIANRETSSLSFSPRNSVIPRRERDGARFSALSARSMRVKRAGKHTACLSRLVPRERELSRFSARFTLFILVLVTLFQGKRALVYAA